MRELIHHLLQPLLRLLYPATGRHRPDFEPKRLSRVRPRRTVVCLTAVTFAPGYFPALRNASGTLVRTRAQISYERWERVNRRLQQTRRRDLWLASYGIDAGPRTLRIHGIAVPR